MLFCSFGTIVIAFFVVNKYKIPMSRQGRGLRRRTGGRPGVTACFYIWPSFVTWLWSWQKRQMRRVDRQSRTGLIYLCFLLCACVYERRPRPTNSSRHWRSVRRITFAASNPTRQNTHATSTTAGKDQTHSSICCTRNPQQIRNKSSSV